MPDLPHGDAVEADLSELLRVLSDVPDRRDPRGKIYALPFILALTLIAVLAGASKFRQIADHAADLPDDVLKKLGGPWCWFQRKILVPSTSTIRLALDATGADTLDELVGNWLATFIPESPGGEIHLCIDGKVMRGVRTRENKNFTLLSAMCQPAGVTVAQVGIPDDTNETTQVTTLLKQVKTQDGQRVIVTLDAAHTARDTARHITEQRGFDYVMTVKGNRARLHSAVFGKTVGLTTHTPDHHTEEQGHGRIRRWSTWITDAEGVNFPGARQTALIKREEFTLTKQRISKHIALILTSQENNTATAVDIHNQVRGHWRLKTHHTTSATPSSTKTPTSPTQKTDHAPWPASATPRSDSSE